jgi:L-fucose isomerase
MATIAVMTVSDGRPYVHLEIESFGLDVQQRIVRALGGLGHRVVTATGDIHSNATAVAVARELAAARPDLTIVNIPVWAFPHFTMLAVRETPGAVLLFSNIDPQYPGMVGLLAAGGGLDQIGRPRPRRGGGQPAAWLDVRPDRRTPDGHVHRGVRHRRLDAEVRHRRRGNRPI